LSKIRILASALSLSAAGLVGLAVHEGYSDKAIIPVKGDVATICFGETRGVKIGDTSDPVRCLMRLQAGLNEYESAVRRCAPVPMYQAEYDLWVNMAYNIGAKNFCYNAKGEPSAIVKQLTAGNYKGACDAILLYRYGPNKFDCSTPGNKVCSGVWKRRLESHAKCLEAAQ